MLLVHSLRRASRSLRSRFLLCACLAAASCVSYGPPATTTVARGEYFSTGNADYDEFFVRLFRLQVALGSEPEALSRARGALSRKLGLTDKAETLQLRSALGTRASELRAHGLSIRVETSREAKGGSKLSVTGTKSAADAELVAAIEEAFTVAARQREGLPGWQKELEALPPRGVALESGLEAAFVGTGRGTRDEIRGNLTDAQKIMGLMGPRLKELDAASAELHSAMTQVFSPPAAAPPPAEPTVTEPDPKSKPRRPASTGRAPAAPKPVRTPGEAPPAPPPKQGPAKPDFEP